MEGCGVIYLMTTRFRTKTQCEPRKEEQTYRAKTAKGGKEGGQASEKRAGPEHSAKRERGTKKRKKVKSKEEKHGGRQRVVGNARSALLTWKHSAEKK